MDINMRGTLMSDDWAEVMRYFGFNDVFCPGDVRAAMESEEDITIYVNSDGGSLVAGTEIYSMIAEYGHHVTAHIQTRAASAATVAMMACHKIVCEPVSIVCIHNPSSWAEGDASVMRHTADELDNIKKSIVAAYMGRTSKTEEEIAALMDKEMWIDATEALENGLVDEILTRRAGPYAIVNAVGAYHFPTTEMIEEFRNQKQNESKREAAKAFLEIYK